MTHLIRFLCWLLPARLAHMSLRALTAVVSVLPENGFLYCYSIKSLEGDPYITRMLMPRWRGRRAMLHWIRRADHDEPHNHPWAWFESRILLGGYTEMRYIADSLRWRRTFRRGDQNVLRGQETFHVIGEVLPRTWTLITVGERCADWGFMVDGGFVPHRQFFVDRKYQAAKGVSKS